MTKTGLKIASYFFLLTTIAGIVCMVADRPADACCREGRNGRRAPESPTTAFTYTGLPNPAIDKWTDMAKWAPSYPGVTIGAGNTATIADVWEVRVDTPVTISGGGALINNDGTAVSDGFFVDTGGTLTVGSGGTFTNNKFFETQAFPFTIQSGGTFINNGRARVSGMNINAGSTVTNNAPGTILLSAGANETITGNFTNGTGTFDIEDKPICTITGNFNNGSGVFRAGFFDLGGGINGFGNLTVTGTATLSGQFNFYVMPVSTTPPAIGQTFTILTAASRVGTFTNSVYNLGGGRVAKVSYTATSVIVTIAAPTASEVSVSGRVSTGDGRGLTNANVTLTDAIGNTQIAVTGRSGAFTFENVESGKTYIVSIGSRRFSYQPQTVSVSDNVSGLVFTPE